MICDTTAAIGTGPGTSPASSSRVTSPVASWPGSASAQLRAPVSTTTSPTRPPAPPATGRTERARGKAVSRLKPSVIACGG